MRTDVLGGWFFSVLDRNQDVLIKIGPTPIWYDCRSIFSIYSRQFVTVSQYLFLEKLYHLISNSLHYDAKRCTGLSYIIDLVRLKTNNCSVSGWIFFHFLECRLCFPFLHALVKSIMTQHLDLVFYPLPPLSPFLPSSNYETVNPLLLAWTCSYWHICIRSGRYKSS